VYQRWSPLKCIKNHSALSAILFGICCTVQFEALAQETRTTKAQRPETKKQKGPANKTIPGLLEEVEATYSKAATLSADFTQITDNVALSQKKKSSGKLYLKRPSQVRWETQKPDVNLFVSNGQTSWFYTPPFDEGEHGQLVVKKSSETHSKLANALLAGSFSVVKGMKIEQKSESSFTLYPRRGTAGTIQKATIEVDLANKFIRKVILDHKGGNHAEITLSNIQLGSPLKNDLFNFVPPPNTDENDPEGD
jgi:outer membrane lipoprotein carrier protein